MLVKVARNNILTPIALRKKKCIELNLTKVEHNKNVNMQKPSNVLMIKCV